MGASSVSDCPPVRMVDQTLCLAPCSQVRRWLAKLSFVPASPLVAGFGDQGSGRSCSHRPAETGASGTTEWCTCHGGRPLLLCHAATDNRRAYSGRAPIIDDLRHGTCRGSFADDAYKDVVRAGDCSCGDETVGNV